MNKLHNFILATSMLFITTAISPFVLSETPTTQNGCPNFPAQLKPGDIALVTDYQSSPLNLRVKSGLDKKIIIKIPTGTLLTIISGPECADGYRWFEVGYNGQDGWSVEVGPDGVYNLILNSATNTDGSISPGNPSNIKPTPFHLPRPINVLHANGRYCLFDWNTSTLEYWCVPNEETLQALGFSPKEATEFELWPQVHIVDVPNVSTDRAGFCEFKINHFPYTSTLNANGPECDQKNSPNNGFILKPPLIRIINIGPDIFVLIDGQRRLVPNPDTLDALGINRNMIDNMGMSDEQLSAIPRGPDIPDVNRDYAGFQAFKALYDKETNSSSSTQLTPVQIVPVPLPPDGPSSDPDFWCFIPGFCVKAAVNISCSPQCVATARANRDDLILWSGSGTSDQILAAAQNRPQFTYKGQLQQVRVRGQGEQPQVGDLVIWPSGCGGAWSPKDANGNKLPGGHIGFVTNGSPLRISDSNWGDAISPTICASRTDQEPTSKQLQYINECGKFITSPYPWPASPDLNPPNQDSSSAQPSVQPVDKCSQYSGFSWILCKIGLKP